MYIKASIDTNNINNKVFSAGEAKSHLENKHAHTMSAQAPIVAGILRVRGQKI